MIDIENYKLAIQWLERGLVEQALDPNNGAVRDSVMLSFEVTYKLSENLLRHALSEVEGSAEVAYLSSRDIMRYGQDEGMLLSSGETWLRYGIALEQANREQDEPFSENLAALLPQYLKELKGFAERLEQRLVAVA